MSKKRPARAGERKTTADPYARLVADFCDLLRTFAPSDEALGHFRNARVEMLKGLRATIDARIERLSAEHQKGTSVTIE